MDSEVVPVAIQLKVDENHPDAIRAQMDETRSSLASPEP